MVLDINNLLHEVKTKFLLDFNLFWWIIIIILIILILALINTRLVQYTIFGTKCNWDGDPVSVSQFNTNTNVG